MPTPSQRIERIAELAVLKLASMPLPVPHEGEREPAFVSRAVAPQMNAWLRSLDIPGLHLGGDGAGPVTVAHFLGRALRPDLTIMSFQRRVFALEAKYIGSSSVLSEASKAVGQGALYAAAGFPHVSLFLLDVKRSLDEASVADARSTLGDMGLGLIVRQRLRGSLSRDEALVSHDLGSNN